jgi:hypothetical protein
LQTDTSTDNPDTDKKDRKTNIHTLRYKERWTDRERKKKQADYKPKDVQRETDTDTNTQTNRQTYKSINSFDFSEKDTIKANFWGLCRFPDLRP